MQRTTWLRPTRLGGVLTLAAALLAACGGGGDDGAEGLREANDRSAKEVLQEVAMTRAPFRGLDGRCEALVEDLSTATGRSASEPLVGKDEVGTAPGTAIEVQLRRCRFPLDGGGMVEVEVQVSEAGTPVTPDLLEAWRGGAVDGVPLDDLGESVDSEESVTIVVAGGPDRGIVATVSPAEAAPPEERLGLARTLVAALGAG